MDHDREEILFKRMKDGCDQARDDLILGHDSLAKNLCKKFEYVADPEDLLQEARLALIRSVDSYDLDKGRLRYYAFRAIQTALYRYLDKIHHFIHVPEHQSIEIGKLIQIQGHMEQELGRLPSEQELINYPPIIEAYQAYESPTKRQLSIEEYVNLLNFKNHPLSLEDEDLNPSHLVDPRSNDSHKKLELEDLGQKLLSILTEQERFVLQSLSEGQSGRSIAKKLNVTDSRVYIIRRESTQKIKNFVANHDELREILSDMNFNI